MIVPLSALFISVVSLGVAILHGRTMEKMAEANAHLVAANSWPFPPRVYVASGGIV